MPVNRWKYKLRVGDVFHDDEKSLAEKGQVIAARIKAAPFWEGNRDELEPLVDELVDAADAEDEHWFDLVWDAFYDWADAERVWVETIRS